VDRRLIRRSLAGVKKPFDSRAGAGRRKSLPPEETHAEEHYHVKQMQARTPMVVVLNDGEELRGWIEWYDKNCIKITRTNAPNLLLYKSTIKYVYKDERVGVGQPQSSAE
jgi:sRNA-binding regulator protein Hfq